MIVHCITILEKQCHIRPFQTLPEAYRTLHGIYAQLNEILSFLGEEKIIIAPGRRKIMSLIGEDPFDDLSDSELEASIEENIEEVFKEALGFPLSEIEAHKDEYNRQAKEERIRRSMFNKPGKTFPYC